MGQEKFLIGVDEAGRGPLAGPVAVGAAMVRPGFDWSQIGGVRDSKKMTPAARMRFFRQMRRLQNDGLLRYSVAFAPPAVIDAEGIAAAVRNAVALVLRRIEAEPEQCSVFLDGLLSAPPQFKRQHTIIGGDDALPLISLAAIAAKVARDRLMVRLSRQYPGYGFERHKGYGTKSHIEALRKLGPCKLHRRTYCSRLLAEILNYKSQITNKLQIQNPKSKNILDFV